MTALSGGGRRFTTGWLRAMLLWGLACAVMLASGIAVARAAVGHEYVCQITGTSSGSASECHSGGSAAAGGVSSPYGLTISGGDLWATSPGTPAVDEFDSSGAFVSQIPGSPASGTYSFGGNARSVAVDDATGQTYVADSGPDNVKVFDGAGAYLTMWTGAATPSGSFGGAYISAAVDNSSQASSGDVYVTDSADEVIDKLDASGNPVPFSGFSSYISGSQITGTPSGPFAFNGSSSSDAITVDALGDIYVADNGNGVVDEFSSSGTFVQSFSGAASPTGSFGSIYAVAVDNATGDVYVSDTGNSAVDEFSSTGAFLGQVTGAGTPAGSFSPGGVAVDSSGDVYVADSANDVIDEFGPGVTVPDVSAEQATSVQSTSAILTGQLDPAGGGPITSCRFEYGTTSSYGQTAPCTPTPPYSSVTDVSAAISGLRPGTIDHFRLDATNANGTTLGADQAFLAPTQPAVAGSPRPDWAITSVATPTRFSAADNANCNQNIVCDRYTLLATNTGSSATDGSTIAIADSLPPGLSVKDISGFDWEGAVTGNTVTCTTVPLICTTAQPIAPDDKLQITIDVEVTTATGTITNTATASGGGAPAATTSEHTLVSSTAAPFGIDDFSFTPTAVDGSPSTQAADHPYELSTTFDLPTRSIDEQSEGVTYEPVEDPKDVVVDLPGGFIGNPQATPSCSLPDMARGQLDQNPSSPTYRQYVTACPPASRVGIISIESGQYGSSGSLQLTGSPSVSTSSVYNITPEGGHAAELGFDFATNQVVMYAHLVPMGDSYGLQITIPGIPNIEMLGVTMTLWGNPGAHDGDPNSTTAFLTNSSDCQDPQVAQISIDSWEHPGTLNSDGTPDLSDPNWKTLTSSSAPLTGCNRLQFNPTITVQPDTTVADSPSGLSVDLSVPQGQSAVGSLATPPLRNATVTLPQGVSVNPSAANGLGACLPAQIALGQNTQPTCPNQSKIGTVQLTTPLLPNPIGGSIYLAQQNNNPFGSLLAIYLVIDDPTTGVLIKLPGEVKADPITGQLTTTVQNNPQFPFSDLQLDFKGGPTGVLATPESCGPFTTNSDFSPWSAPDSGPDATPSDSFSIDSGCVSGFSPSFTAGTQNAQAGAYSPFVVSMSRSDTDQNLQGLTVTLPPGMLAKLAGVTECSEQQLASISSAPGTGAAQAANPSCPAGSQVGTVTTGAGTGPDPFFLGGKAYLTGPYKGAPYGLAVVVPAVAGPLDLGTVVVRQALYIDPTTAQVTDVSDPFPTILDGIPLRIRRIDVDLNRPDFTLNPTSCDPMSITGALTSTGGLSADVSSRFQVGGCAALGFSPKLKIALTGKGKTRSGDHPTLTATLTQPFGQANIQSARVALPLSLALDPNNSNNVCNYDVAQAVHGGAVGCPASTIVGSATAVTPLLSQPLTGNVYLVQGIRFNSQGQRIRTLPSLLIPLRGQIALDLRAQSSVNGAQQLVTTFSTIPDAPVSKFTLNITGGKKGLLVITGRGRTICGKSQVARSTLGAQSGKTEDSSIKLSTPCGTVKHPRHAKKHRKSGHAKRR